MFTKWVSFRENLSWAVPCMRSAWFWQTLCALWLRRVHDSDAVRHVVRHCVLQHIHPTRVDLKVSHRCTYISLSEYQYFHSHPVHEVTVNRLCFSIKHKPVIGVFGALMGHFRFYFVLRFSWYINYKLIYKLALMVLSSFGSKRPRSCNCSSIYVFIIWRRLSMFWT